MKPICAYLFLSLVFFYSCNIAPVNNDSIPEHITFTLDSKQVNETRTINVWTPPEYQTGSDSVPVLYMANGGIKEDFPPIANTLADLISQKKIPPIMLVGIENTKRQRGLTGPTEIEKDKKLAEETGESANFRAFLTQELIPEIREKYRTTERKGIIGESLSGLFVMETYLLQPDAFDFYISFDPSLWWNNHTYDLNAAKYLENLPDKKTIIWFGSSSEARMYKAAQIIAYALEDIPAAKLNWKFSDEPKEKHHTIFRASKEKAIIWALNAE